MPRLYNKHDKDIPADAVLIDRTTPFGNPFRIGPDGTRRQVCEKFRNHVDNMQRSNHPLIARAVAELKGHDLVCHCYPLECHGETWLEVVNK